MGIDGFAFRALGPLRTFHGLDLDDVVVHEALHLIHRGGGHDVSLRVLPKADKAWAPATNH